MQLRAFLLLASIALAIDSVLIRGHAAGIQTLTWTFASSIPLGAILLFSVLFLFVVTLVAHAVFRAIRFLSVAPGIISLIRHLEHILSSSKDRRMPHGYVLISQLKDYALSDKEQFYLLDYAEKEERAIDSAEAVEQEVAILSISVLLFIAINAIIGVSKHATIAWKVFDAAQNGNAIVLFLL
jgi:hypothetical protein